MLSTFASVYLIFGVLEINAIPKIIITQKINPKNIMEIVLSPDIQFFKKNAENNVTVRNCPATPNGSAFVTPPVFILLNIKKFPKYQKRPEIKQTAKSTIDIGVNKFNPCAKLTISIISPSAKTLNEIPNVFWHTLPPAFVPNVPIQAYDTIGIINKKIKK
ncbi:hypothetical protein FACS189459_6950 [Bacilli bacterium]|nr:hypothetical protein FACS189459_6950 [Bacilli bacterium]